MNKAHDEHIAEDVKDATVIVDDDVMTAEESQTVDGAPDDVAQEAATQRRMTTYIAIIILLAGVAAGSFFVDIAQLFSGKGFSARALKDAQVVEYDGYTWVRYDDSKIVV